MSGAEEQCHAGQLKHLADHVYIPYLLHPPPSAHLVIPPQAAYVDGEQGAGRYAPSRTSSSSSCGCSDL